jgi:hypothetical protein
MGRVGAALDDGRGALQWAQVPQLGESLIDHLFLVRMKSLREGSSNRHKPHVKHPCVT